MVEVSSASVHEAVAQVLRIFRDNEWVDEIGHGQTPIVVKVKHPEIEHTVRVQDFERWLEARPRSPAEMISKNRLREFLARAIDMCGRFSMTWRDKTEMATMLGVPESELGDYRPRFNIAPTQPYFVLKTTYESREAIPATGAWLIVGRMMPTRPRSASMRAETMHKLPSYREAFKLRRCVVPADEFYEWRGPETIREPLWIHPAKKEPILFAGLFESWQVQPGQWQTTFCIIITAANRLLEPVQNRTPVILDAAGAADWMKWREPDPLSLKRLLVPAPENLLVVRPASPLVNIVKNDGPELLEDLSLFGQ